MGSSPIQVAICGNYFASVAQLVEQRTENPRVVGSIPTGGTKRCKCLPLTAFLYFSSTFSLNPVDKEIKYDKIAWKCDDEAKYSTLHERRDDGASSRQIRLYTPLPSRL